MTDPNPSLINSSGLDVSTVSGGITDRTSELLGLINQFNSQAGAGTISLNLEGLDEQTILNTISVALDPDQADWGDDKTYYYKGLNLKLSSIQEILNRNIADLQTNLSTNINQLFGILNTKASSINTNLLQNSITADGIDAAANVLEAQLNTNLTSDEALNEMMNQFFTQLNVTIEKINNEIFDLMGDFDDNDTAANDAPKYLIPRTGVDANGDPLESSLYDNFNDLYDATMDDARTAAGNPANFSENDFMTLSVQSLYSRQSLKLDPDLVEYIIQQKGLTAENLTNYKSTSDFLRIVSYPELTSYANHVFGTNGQATINKLFRNNLEITTAKYYEGNGNLKALLFGRKNLDQNSNVDNVIFGSLQNLLNNFGYSATEMLELGYEKPATSPLNQSIRRNPYAAITYLEAARPNADANTQAEIDEQIGKLKDRQIKILNLELEVTGSDQDRINELINSIQTGSQTSTEIANELEAYFSEANADNPNYQNPYSAEIANLTDLDSVLAASDEENSLFENHRLLYSSEMEEASSINNRSYGQKLPEPNSDGTIPEETNKILPPWVSPTLYSGVIAYLGNTLLEKTKALIKNPTITLDDQWLNDNMGMLGSYETQIQSGEISSAGEAFFNNLKENFKGIINNFYDQFDGLKQESDFWKNLLENGNPSTMAIALNIRNIPVPPEASPEMLEAIIAQQYKTSLLTYSNALTNVNNDQNQNGIADLQEQLSQSIDSAGFDSDGNGVNDFIDLNGIMGNIDTLSEQLGSIFGDGSSQQGVAVEDQSIKRLILMMFVFNMLEQDAWDFAQADADTSGYEVTSD